MKFLVFTKKSGSFRSFRYLFFYILPTSECILDQYAIIKTVTMYRENKQKFKKTQNRLVSPNCDIKFDLISVCFSPLPTILAEKLLTLRSLQLQLLRTVKQKTFFANFCRNSPLLPLLNFKLHLQNFSTKAILKTMPILIYKCHL